MSTYGLYLNGGGFNSNYFEIQSEAQVQYTCLGAPDAWRLFAEQNGWPLFVDEIGKTRVGKMQAEPRRQAAERLQWIKDWQDVWRRLVVIHPRAISRFPSTG